VKFAAIVALATGCGFSVNPGTGDGGTGSGDAPDAPVGSLTSPRRLTLGAVTEQLTDFPLLVPLTSQQLDLSKVANPQTDLRFEDAAGTHLDFEVERWSTTEDSIVWVRVPSIPAGAPSSILMYFGSGVGASNPNGVWKGYEQVTHFGPSLIDSTGHNHDGTATGATAAAGVIGNATSFGGGSDRVTFTVPLLDQWPQFTFEAWIRPNYASASELGGAQPHVISNNASFNLGRLFENAGKMVFQIDVNWSGAVAFQHPETPPAMWTYVAWTYDNADLHVYQDGALALTEGIGSHNLANSNGALVLGHTVNGAKMTVDEMRISQTGHTAAWFDAQHRSMRRMFVTFGAP
jgi:hypothetical protein